MITMGTVMEIERKKALVFTMDGSVVNIKPRLGLFVGQQVAFSRKEVVSRGKKVLTALPYAAMAAAVLAVAVLAAGFFGLWGGILPAGQQCAAYIVMDINPSIQFKIDEGGKVISANALNADGRMLLASFDPVGKAINDAVDEAILWAKSLGYIKDTTGVVLIAGTLNDGNSRIAGSRSEYRDKLQAILGGLGGNGDADILALYVDDSSVKDNADKNGISLGRELLREFASQNNIDLQDDEIRSGRITDLLDKIGDEATKSMPVVKPQPENTAQPTEAQATAEPTVTPTDQPTATPTEKPKANNTPIPTLTPKPAEQPTAKPAPTATPVIAGIKARAVAGGIRVDWPKASTGAGKFLYYKVVLSLKDSTPSYPACGYAVIIKDKFTLSAVIKPNSAYRGGDLGGKVKPGASYTVSVMYVYEHEYRFGNAVRVKCPEPPPEHTEPPDSYDSDYSVTAYAVDGDNPRIHVKWDKAPESGFQGYKVVFSKYDSSPRYPDQGYLYYITNIDDTSCDAEPNQGYNGGDVGGKLKAGVSYYISVTYLCEDGKRYGSVKRVTMPGTPEPEEPAAGFSSPGCSATLDGTTLKVSWNTLPADDVTYGGDTYHDFQYYKVVVADHPNPTYPEDHYKFYSTNRGCNSANVGLGGAEYVSGSTCYVAITYYFSDGRFFPTDVSFTIP